MAWWMWILLGVTLLVVDIVTPGGLLALFFGVSAFLVAGLAATGAAPGWLEWLLWAGAGVALVAVLRRRLAGRLRRRREPVDALVGEVAFPLEDLAPGATGRAELRGVPWTATNEGDAPVARGQRCRVSRVTRPATSTR